MCFSKAQQLIRVELI